MPNKQIDSSHGGGSDDGSFFSGSQSSASENTSRRSDDYDETSTFLEEGSAYSSSNSSGSMDSIGAMLVQMEDDDVALKDLVVDCKSLDRKAAKYISQFLPDNTHITKLHLQCGDRSSHNQILNKVLLGLSKGNGSVEHIIIQGAVINREVASWLVPSFAHHPKMKKFSIVKCKFEGAALGILFVAMQHNKHVRHISFCSCDWDEHNTDVLSSSLQYFNLNTLSLVDVNISADSWPYLLQSIEQCKELIQLDLSRNVIDCSNINLLTKCVCRRKTISKLVLSSCGLDDRCVKELAKGLRKYKTLTSLDISQNTRMTDTGVVYLKDLLKFNNAVTELKVDGCCLNKQSMAAIDSGLRYNNSFLKSFFSESTATSLFGVVDSIEDSIEKMEKIGIREQIGEGAKHIAEVVSFDSDSSPKKKRMQQRKKPANSMSRQRGQTARRVVSPTGSPNRKKSGTGSNRRMLL